MYLYFYVKTCTCSILKAASDSMSIASLLFSTSLGNMLLLLTIICIMLFIYTFQIFFQVLHLSDDETREDHH